MIEPEITLRRVLAIAAAAGCLLLAAAITIPAPDRAPHYDSDAVARIIEEAGQ